MENENESSETTPNTETDAVNYIEVIKEIKQNTVSKSEYEKLQNENKQLLQSLVNGEYMEKSKEEEPIDLENLRKDLQGKDMTNLEYVSTALKLRNETIKKGDRDPFLPYGKNILPTDDDVEKAEKVANVLQECVDIADGDADVFTNELQRRLVDSPINRRK